MNNNASIELRAIARDAMRQRGLQPDLPAAAQRQLDGIVGPGMERGEPIRDLRGLLWCSIDNDDSRDLDQLSVAIPVADADRDRNNGATRILVAIADVDCMVAPDSAIDAHARHNTTSVYTAAGVFPMLPERLSTDLSSLNEQAERLAIVVDMYIEADGTVASQDSAVYRALVQNKAQLAYNAVAAWLNGEAPAPPKVAALTGLDEQLRTQDRIAQALKRQRHARGALSLATPEVRPVFSEGVLTDLRPDLANRAKDLIANLMIAANGVTARYLERSGFPSLRRMLRAPARWDRIVALAAQVGETLPGEPSPGALDGFLAKRRAADPARFGDLSLAIVKLLGSGEYTVSVPGRATPGHFGLAVNDYTHSTAPNRRYPDLVTQRLLKAALADAGVPFGEHELAELAAHCTEQEDNAQKVERQVRKSAAALLLAERIGQDFDALVTGASAKGTWVRITQPNVEGRVVRGFEGLDVGEKLRVMLVGVDAQRGHIDFEALR
ncbi:MAG TPA: RNB domain-containing ribonuclease [Burkholderiaceae bacterium]